MPNESGKNYTQYYCSKIINVVQLFRSKVHQKTKFPAHTFVFSCWSPLLICRICNCLWAFPHVILPTLLPLCKADSCSSCISYTLIQGRQKLCELFAFFFCVQDDGHNIEYYTFICTNSNTIIWLAVSFAYKGLLQILAIFMAFHTRKIKIKALNDSKETAAIIYFNNMVLVTLIMSEFALISLHNIYTALFGLALLVGATIFLSLIFLPQVFLFY